jgi:ATP-dependent DNA helicase DinG
MTPKDHILEHYIAPDAAEGMRHAIEQADGNEVFFLGYIEEDFLVHDIEVVSRGHQTAVPAVMKRAQEADVVIHNHPSGQLTPSEADLSIASQLDDFSVAFYIVDNDLARIYVVVEPFSEQEIQPLDTFELLKLLSNTGPIARHLPGFEKRPSQEYMVEAVSDAFNENKISLIEAGTGTGKTIAYLLPSIAWSLQNNERIVISTNTINLQEQLIKKDIPLLKQSLDHTFEAVLVKGRGNYVCLRKIDDLESEFDLLSDDNEQEELRDLIQWAHRTQDGSKSDLPWIPRDSIWEKIASESDTCTRSKCPHFRDCFVNKARRQAARAHILIVNHHLLFADLALRHQLGGNVTVSGVLPPYQRIILDEAHHLEDVATHYFGIRVTRYGLLRLLGRLHRKQKDSVKGLLHTLRHRLRRQGGHLSREQADKLESKASRSLIPDLISLTDLTDRTLSSIFDILALHYTDDSNTSFKVRLISTLKSNVMAPAGLFEQAQDLIRALKHLSSQLLHWLDTLESSLQRSLDDWISLIIEVRAVAERLALMATGLEDVLFTDDEDHIRWIEGYMSSRGKPVIRFAQCPLDIGQTMTEAVYDNYRTVVMTSATLTVDNAFKFIQNRIGLQNIEEQRQTSFILPAPFDYPNQVLLGVPSDLPDPNHPSFSGNAQTLVYKLLHASQGRAFVLFTSYGLLNRIYNELADSLEMLGYTPLKQGTMNRHELLDRFRRDTHSVLFATDSFWEGVDVVGDALQLIIITRLPFKVPKDPIVEARYEKIEREGGNAFIQYAVPMAIIKFRQGFGRLIRSRSDRGVVIILDNRVIRKNYGKRFIRSLPPCDHRVAAQSDLVQHLTTFFHS